MRKRFQLVIHHPRESIVL